jgi:hypothetical protein
MQKDDIETSVLKELEMRIYKFDVVNTVLLRSFKKIAFTYVNANAVRRAA